MADNYTTAAGSGGNTYASDDIGSVHYPRVKVSLGVDGVAVDAPGEATYGMDVDVTRLPALAAGTNNIGDVDVLTVPAPLNVVGGGTEAAALRVTLASDSTGVVSIDDNGGSLTVDGAVSISGTVTVAAHAVTNAGTFATQVDGAALTALQLIDNIVLAEDAAHVSADPGVQLLAVRKATPVNLSGADGDYEPLQVSAGKLWVSATVDAALPTGTNSIGTVQPGNTANTTPWLVTDTPATSGGLSAGRIISAATTNATSLKGSAGQVYTIIAHNINAAVRYLKLYNKATAPTVGTDTPVLTLPIPGNAAGAGFAINLDKGWAFSTGIAAAITTGVADADTGAVASNEIVINFGYK